jgi:hypothetical protein
LLASPEAAALLAASLWFLSSALALAVALRTHVQGEKHDSWQTETILRYRVLRKKALVHRIAAIEQALASAA